jgi:hypothetical protein
MSRPTKKGRVSEPRHIRIYHRITGSRAWQAASGNAIKLLIAVMRLNNGENNILYCLFRFHIHCIYSF